MNIIDEFKYNVDMDVIAYSDYLHKLKINQNTLSLLLYFIYQYHIQYNCSHQYSN